MSTRRRRAGRNGPEDRVGLYIVGASATPKASPLAAIQARPPDLRAQRMILIGVDMRVPLSATMAVVLIAAMHVPPQTQGQPAGLRRAK